MSSERKKEELRVVFETWGRGLRGCQGTSTRMRRTRPRSGPRLTKLPVTTETSSGMYHRTPVFHPPFPEGTEHGRYRSLSRELVTTGPEVGAE